MRSILLVLGLLLGSLNVWGTDVTYTFTSKSWADASSAWTGGGDGNGFTTGQGIQVTTGTTGANATSKSSFSNVSKVVVTYNTNKSKGAGSIVIKIGTNNEVSNSVAYSGSSDGTSANFTTQFDFSPVQTGAIKITTNTTTNSIWVKSITITYSDGGTPQPTPSLDHIAITGTPSKTYEQGQSFDPTGLTVTAYYDDDTNANVTGDVEWSFNPATFTVAGENKSVTATATYQEKEASETYNDITVTEHVVTAGTYDITFNNAFFGTTGLTGSLSGTNLKDYSGSKDDITVEYKKGTGSNMYLKDSEIRLYSGNTLVITAPSGYNITSVTGLKSTMTANEGTITDTEWSGESNSVTFSHNDTKGNSSLATISVTYAAVDMSKPVTPTFSVAAGIYTEAQSVEINCVTDGATIYYTTDGSTPDNTSTEYTGNAISLSERGTYTIKAIAIKGEDESAVASATYTINLPYIFASVSELFTYLDENSLTTLNDVTVTGYVSEIVTEYSTQYSNISFNISDDGSTTAAQLQSYRGKGTDASSIEVGDKVTISGNYKVHNSTKELDQNNTITNRIAKGAVTSVAVSGTATKTTYSANETFETAGLVVTATYANGFSEVVTEGIEWNDDLTGHKVAATGTVHVTATVDGVISAAYDVAIEVSTKELSSIAVGTDSYTVYKGQALPKPVITATYTEGEPADVSAEAVYDKENVFDNTTVGTYNITVSYIFGGATKTTTYTVTVKDYANDAAHPYTVADAKQLIETIFADESTDDIYVHGIVSEIVEAYQAKFGNVTYNISDDGTTSGAQIKVFRCTASSADDIKEGDEVIVKGHAIYYQSSTPELLNTPTVVSLARTPNFEIADVASLEVGADDLVLADLTIETESEGAITLSIDPADAEKATIVSNAIHAVGAGTVTVTADLEADGIYKAATTTFSVTVIPAQVKYAITFNSNGADGGSAPEAIADKAAGAEVTLPANSYTKTGHTFNGWKVFYVDGESVEHEVTISENAFTMPAFAVTIQAQWAEVSKWATTYTSNVGMEWKTSGAEGTITIGTDDPYTLVKAGASKNVGTIEVTIPAKTHTLHFHAFAWGGKTAKIQITGVENPSVTEFNLVGEEGAAGNGNDFTLQGNPVDQYFSVTFDAVATETIITFSKADGSADNRFFLYGVNQEGGVLPVLKSIEISGDLTTKSGYKAGDDLNMEGLTVNAIYTLNEVEQDPVDVTADVEWSYDALVEGQTSVTITAKYEGKTDDITINDLEAVASADPVIYVDKLSVNFGTVAPNASVENKTITVTLTNVAAATATLGGTNPEAFSITPASPAALTTSGDITISVVSTANVGTYSATITISDDAEAATSKVVNLSLIVEDVETPVLTTSKWVAAEAADLVDGAEVLIVGVNNTDYYAMGVQNSNNRAAVAASVDGEGVLTPGEGTMSFILVAQGDGTFALRTSNSKYLYAAASGSNHLKTQAEVNDDAKWTLTATSAKAESSTNRNVMQFNSGSSIFSCYASASQKTIAFYIPYVEPTPEPVYETVRENLEPNRYYTICLPKKVIAIKGASFWTLKSKSQDGATAYLEEETNNLPFAAGKPFIIQATAAKLEVVYEGAATEDAGTNGALHGTLVYMNAAALAAAGGSNVYMLFSNALRPVGENNHLDANRAYVLLSELNAVTEAPQSAPGRRVRAMPMQPQVATGLENGELMNDAMVKKVLINGQLFILRGEKIYDAKGQLVK